MHTWLDGVRDESRWADTKHAGTGAFADHAMRTIHIDKRRAAGRFLRGVRTLYEIVRGEKFIQMPLKQQPYGDWEFEVRDPNGYVLDCLTRVP